MPPRIAIIDDELVFLNLLHELLSEEGYAPHAFREGAASYDRVRALVPHAVVLDIHPERPDAGWDLLDRFRQDALLCTTPIIVCSAAVAGGAERAAQMQGDGYAALPKPFALGDLLVLLDRLTGESS